ncbi:MAG: pyridoxal phosphate-dependent aminotransferase, partial [Vicinamibacteria bacterium]
MKEPAASPGERLTQSRYDLMKIAATLEDVISLGVGDPDLHTSHDIVRRTTRELLGRRPSSDPRGLPELRQAVATRYRLDKGLTFDLQSEILITNGAQEGLFLAVMALVNPGDEVLLPDPRYSSYDQAVEAAGGLVVEVPTDARHDFQLEAREVRARGSSAKLLIFPNPSNPTGALVREEGVREIAKAARETGILVLSDEVYETLVYDGAKLQSMAPCEAMRERTITLSSVSKSYAMTGFRLGYLLGPPAFIEGASRLKAAISGPCPLYSQCAALAALAGPQDVTREILETLAGRRRVMMEG